MADRSRRIPENVPGAFFVDDSCIDCDLCRQISPDVFVASGGQSVVGRQPSSAEARDQAAMALVACPTASIGSDDVRSVRAAARRFPDRIDGNVYFCGYASERSFGAKSYLIVRREGNVLVDSPRFARPLVRRMEQLGGVQTMFLTHRDDVADHALFRKHFGCDRVMHRSDAGGIEAETYLDGHDPVELGAGLLAIPTPGHTSGHVVLLYGDRFLFTGDHLAWSDTYRHLIAFRRQNWYSWSETIRSVARLRDYRFEWVLPGHGRQTRLDPGAAAREIDRCVRWMRRAG